jgi:hypothetical protein
MYSTPHGSSVLTEILGRREFFVVVVLRGEYIIAAVVSKQCWKT